MKILTNHWTALGATRKLRWRHFLCSYGCAVSVAVLFWFCWSHSLTKDTLNIIATVQSVVATVLLTVMGSIYTGLPGAVRRARIARKRASAATATLADAAVPDMKVAVHQPRARAEFEDTRLDVLKGIFAHTATAVLLALVSLPLILTSAQMEGSTGAVATAREWVVLGVLALVCSTMAVVFIVLLEVHRLVQIDVDDDDPTPEG